MFEMGVLPPLLKVIKVEQGEVRMKAVKALVDQHQNVFTAASFFFLGEGLSLS
jgi:hypothetical protein